MLLYHDFNDINIRVCRTDELEKIARRLADVDPSIPFTVLAFFPEYKMKNFKGPTVEEMVEAYQRVKAAGVENIRLGNLGVFVSTEADRKYLEAGVDPGAY